MNTKIPRLVAGLVLAASAATAIATNAIDEIDLMDAELSNSCGSLGSPEMYPCYFSNYEEKAIHWWDMNYDI
jgi:hypothetical protein